jgi:hypothetical protein
LISINFGSYLILENKIFESKFEINPPRPLEIDSFNHKEIFNEPVFCG